MEELEKFAEKHTDAEGRLRRWSSTVEAAEWRNPLDMKMTFRTADVVGSQTVFNIGGNNYRLIARVNYALQIVRVQQVLTHAEYDKGEWKG